MPRNFHILTFGCQMNQRDSDWLAAALHERGFQVAPISQADYVLLNTCSVREKPEKKVETAIRKIRREAPQAAIIVLGCVAQQLGAALHAFDPAVRLVAGPDAIAKIPDLLLAGVKESGTPLLAMSRDFQERPAVNEPVKSGQAFVTIMQGCDNYCAYCIVPYTRGPQKSRRMAAILAECRDRIEHGAVEITLLGQNVSAWSDGGLGFAELLRAIGALPGLRRLRFITAHPKDMGEDIVACFAEIPVLCPALHLPLQAGSDRILKAMRRRYGRADYLSLVEALKRARPDLALATDLIVGFPGETEADFNETLEMMRECCFISSFSFCYSDRPGTRSALMPDKIAPEIKQERLSRLQSLQEQLTTHWLQDRVGQEAELLLERPSPRGPAASWQGRDQYGTCVHAVLPGEPCGKLVKVTIKSAKKHCLTGEVIAD